MYRIFFLSIHRLVILQTMYGQKKNFSTFSYKLVQFSPIMILVNSGAFLSISSWFCELTELIFVMIPYFSSTGYPPKTQGIMGHVQVANSLSWLSLKFVLNIQPPSQVGTREKHGTF